MIRFDFNTCVDRFIDKEKYNLLMSRKEEIIEKLDHSNMTGWREKISPELVKDINDTAQYIRDNYDCLVVIGIGGGSPLDAAKAIALLIANPTEGADYLYNPEKKEEPLNVVAIPTTCGTGSEVTGVSVLTRKELGTKKSIAHKIFPEVALIDPKYLRSASLTLICNTAMDAFGHMAESALSKTRCSECLDAVEKGLKLFSEVKNYLVKAASSDEVMFDFTWDVYEKLILASMYGGIAIAYAGTTIPHGLSYQVTIRHNVPHGKAIGYFQYGFLKEAPKEEE